MRLIQTCALSFLSIFSFSCSSDPVSKIKWQLFRSVGNLQGDTVVDFGNIDSSANFAERMKPWVGKRVIFQRLQPTGFLSDMGKSEEQNECGFIFGNTTNKLVAWINTTPISFEIDGSVIPTPLRATPMSPDAYLELEHLFVPFEACSDSIRHGCNPFLKNTSFAGYCPFSDSGNTLSGILAGINEYEDHVSLHLNIEGISVKAR